MKTILLILTGLLFSISGIHSQTVMDYDGNAYDTVVIGAQVWLKQNLRTTHYSNGTPIPLTTDSTEWNHTVTGSRCYYNNDSAAFDTLYGALYNGYVINDVNAICPAGWHVSTNEEWEIAEDVLGGIEVAGGKMKESGTTHWIAPNTYATNSSGFTGLPGGLRDLLSTYACVGENGLFWTSSAYNNSTLWTTYLYYLSPAVDHNPAPQNYGLNIRCVKDEISKTSAAGIDLSISLYPNPASHRIYIGYAGTGDLQVQFYSLSGICVMHHIVNHISPEIDINRLSAGVYIVSITADGQTLRRKLIKK
jgi:uncharacterized protein (TIGR02145 family)